MWCAASWPSGTQKPDAEGPSWLTPLGHAKDSLWSVDLFRCESAVLRAHWVLVVMDHYTRRIVGFGVHAGAVDGVGLCRMFNRATRGDRLPKYVSSAFLAHTSFDQSALFFPVAVSLHVLEESQGFPTWARRFASENYSDREYVVVHILAIVSALASVALIRAFPSSWLLYGFVAFVFGPGVLCNMMFHIGASVVTRTYCPGVLTSALVYAPLSVLLLFLGLRDGLFTTTSLVTALDLAFAHLGGMAKRARNCETGDRHRRHRQGFRLWWTWKSRRRLGRPPVPADIRTLIRTMAEANPRWGAPRIHGELLKIGIDISQATVAKYMGRRHNPPSQTWRTFLDNHVEQIVAADFFVVPTVTFRLVFVLVLLAHDRRRIRHFAVTAHPTAAWTAQQIREAFPWDEAPRYLLHDRDHAFDRLGVTAPAMGIEDLTTAPHAPWLNPFVERFVGSARRECFDHAIAFNEAGVRKLMTRYRSYYEKARTHLALAKDAPIPRRVMAAGEGDIVAVPEVGGLHHRYERRAA